ncbi:hypothetical protein B0H19DRAFT_1200947 [Mycena capillaripes]|nr:hypothetical protein B0H19DRAFT_1200947 [Mycena capillaripes]
MVLEKRKRDGGFEPWRPVGSSSSPPKASGSTPTAPSSQVQATVEVGVESDEMPPTKKPRQAAVTPKTIPTYPSSTQVASSSQNSLPTQPSPGKKTRKKAAEQAALPPEKRGAMFKKKCPQNILDRVERVMTQRFFMVDRKRFEGELKEEFQVLGSTGNIYTVTIEHKPSCDCPDAQKGNHCKHILFIYLKVLQIAQTSGLWYQKALLTSELETIFANAPLAPNALAHSRIREAYARATGKSQAPSTPEASAGPKKRVPGEEDDCPICYDNMHGAAEGALIFCEECGNAVHKECFTQWKQTSAKQGNKLTCIYCRAVWPTAAVAGVSRGSGAHTTAEGYINVAGVAGLSPQRDTSTYYHGPRRGQRYYGYNDYDDDY